MTESVILEKSLPEAQPESKFRRGLTDDQMQKVAKTLTKSARRLRDMRAVNTAHEARPAALDNYLNLAEKFGRAADLKSFEAASKLKDRILEQLNTLGWSIKDLKQSWKNLDIPNYLVQNEDDVLEDLKQLHNEKDIVEVKLGRDHGIQYLHVITSEVVLEGVMFGEFDIKFDIVNLDYWLSSLRPNRSRGRRDVIHPHVEANQLCEGEAAVPIECALRSANILDCVLTIVAALNNYNAASPYVSLKEWEAFTCSDCGEAVREDERILCPDSRRYYDKQCMVVCELTGVEVSFASTIKCEITGKRIRSSKASSCAGCGLYAAPNELKKGTDAKLYCPHCFEDIAGDQDDANETET